MLDRFAPKIALELGYAPRPRKHDFKNFGHVHMVSEEVHTSQHAATAIPDNAGMDSTWARVERVLRERRKRQQWLADQLGYTKQRIATWKHRGAIPAEEFDAVELVLGKPPGWLAGRVADDSADEPELSAMGQQIAREFDTIADPKKALAAFAQIIAVIERARQAT